MWILDVFIFYFTSQFLLDYGYGMDYEI